MLNVLIRDNDILDITVTNDKEEQKRYINFLKGWKESEIISEYEYNIEEIEDLYFYNPDEIEGAIKKTEAAADTLNVIIWEKDI